MQNESETPEGDWAHGHQKGNTRTCQKPKKETRLGRGAVNSCTRRKTGTEDQRLWNASALLTACSDEATNDECQNFWKCDRCKINELQWHDTMCHSKWNYGHILEWEKGFM